MRYPIYLEVRDASGDLSAGTSVSIYSDATKATLCALWDARSGAGALANPITSDANGLVICYCDSPTPYYTCGSATARALTLVAEGSSVWNVRDYGARGVPGVDYTSVMNTALVAVGAAGGGKIIVPDGDYLISAPLVIYSNTELELMPGATIKLAAGSNCNMLNNSGMTAVRSVADAAITATDKTLTSATGAFTSADVGRTVVIAGGMAATAPLVANIASVTSGTEVELDTPAGATVSGAACSIFARNQDIIVHGGTWDRQSNAGSTVSLHSLRLRFIDGLHIYDTEVHSDAGKYSISLGACTQFTVERIGFDSFSDGVHVNGPASVGFIHEITGTTGDDTVGLTACDYADYNDVCGNITDVVVSDITASTAYAVVKLTTGAGTWLDNLQCKHITQLGAGRAWAISDDTGAANMGRVCFNAIHGLGYVDAAGSIGELSFHDLYHVPLLNTQPAINIIGGCTVKHLRVDGAFCDSASYTNDHLLTVNQASTITHVDMANIHWRNQSAYLLQFNDGASLVTDFNLVNAYLDGISTSGGIVAAATAGATLTSVHIANVYAANKSWILDTNVTSSVYLSNVKMPSGSFNVRASGNVTVYGSGIVSGQPTVAVGGVLRSKSIDFPTDASKLALNNGDLCYNTNAALGCGAGPAISEGTHWKNLYTGSTT